MDVREFLLRLFRYVILWICAAKAIAGTTDPNTPDSKYVEFGREFPGVVQIRNIVDCEKCETRHSQIASAVLIRPNWALTAAHVVDNADNHVILIADKEYPLPYVVKHKDYVDENVGFHDIALVYSPAVFSVKPYPLYRKADEVGRAVTIAGWGSHGTFSTGAKNFDTARRGGHNKLDSAERAILICSPSVTDRFPLEFGIAPGDSGGGMFIGDELAGINSFLMAEDKKPDGTYGDQSAFTRVSLYADWVDLQIQKYEAALQGRATTGADITDLPVVK